MSGCSRNPAWNAIARTNLGSAYFERGDEDAALHWFREAHRVRERFFGDMLFSYCFASFLRQEVDEFNMQADPTNREIAKELQVCMERSAASGDVLEYRHGYADERHARLVRSRHGGIAMPWDTWGLAGHWHRGWAIL
eukprot:Skav223367  [mRNA]  locus=scaffold200:651353:654429:+ [translate_table: standard]